MSRNQLTRSDARLPLAAACVVASPSWSPGSPSAARWRLPVPYKPLARHARIRAVRPEDRQRIDRAFRALDPRSVYQRFFCYKRALSDGELRWVTEPDGNRQVTLVATIRDDAGESIVGLAQYIRRGSSAEVAFIVAEDYQGRGIASRMLRQLADIACRHGVTQFEADVLADNDAMLKVFRRSGLPVSESEADGVIHVTLRLDARCRGLRATLRRLAMRYPRPRSS